MYGEGAGADNDVLVNVPGQDDPIDAPADEFGRYMLFMLTLPILKKRGECGLIFSYLLASDN